MFLGTQHIARDRVDVHGQPTVAFGAGAVDGRLPGQARAVAERVDDELAPDPINNGLEPSRH
jgi:hypothetical protein